MSQIAALFPGQGSQHVGMGRELAEAYSVAAEIFERANEALGFDLSGIAWKGPESDLKQTQNAQPAILAHSYAVWKVLESDLAQDVKCAAGHSLGEFSAYAAAGALHFEDAVRLVRVRGELMAASPSGGMAALVGLEASEVEKITETVREEGGTLVAANYNSPKQIVVSGEPTAVERACELADAAGARMARPLAVSGAFHSPLMKDAEEGLKAELESVDFSDPAFPVISNVTAQPITAASDAKELLVKQLTSPVRWTESMMSIAERGLTELVELGPGNVLSGLLRRIEPEMKGRAIGGPKQVEQLREALG